MLDLGVRLGCGALGPGWFDVCRSLSIWPRGDVHALVVVHLYLPLYLSTSTLRSHAAHQLIVKHIAHTARRAWMVQLALTVRVEFVM